MSYMGIDIGTSGCKAVVFGAGGEHLAESHQSYETRMPQAGWAELDSATVMRACMTVIRTAAAASRDPVRAISVSSQGEAFTAVAADGTYLTPAMVSFDMRAKAVTTRWCATFGAERLYELTGHTPHPMFTLFKLLWLREERPDIWRRARRFLCFEDLLHLRLGLEPAIGYSLAGRTMLFDVREHRWSAPILAAAGIEPERLARPAPAGAVIGEIPAAIAADLNLGPGVSVVAGGHDQPCGALGVGVLDAGKAAYSLGTVECITPAFAAPVFSRRLMECNLCTYDYTAAGMYTTVAFALTGGNLLRWFRDTWGQPEIEAARRSGRSPYDLLIDAMADAPDDLLVLPHFTPTGTPHFDPDATGAILGLRLTTTRNEILGALLEGVALEMKLNVTILEESGIAIRECIGVGGGSRSARLMQLKADVLNRPITAVAVTEASCLGTALLACRAMTDVPLRDLAAAWVKPVRVVEPDAERARRFETKFAKYRQLYPALKLLR